MADVEHILPAKPVWPRPGAGARKDGEGGNSRREDGDTSGSAENDNTVPAPDEQETPGEGIDVFV